MRLVSLLIMALVAAVAPLAAQQDRQAAPYAYTQLEDPAKEAAALELMHSLRCLTCQSQSIADSDAPMAGDMRHQVRSRIAAGESPDQIRGWLVERYGDYVTYSPEVSSTTWPLFAIPVVLILLALLVLVKRLGSRTGEDDFVDDEA